MSVLHLHMCQASISIVIVPMMTISGDAQVEKVHTLETHKQERR